MLDTRASLCYSIRHNEGGITNKHMKDENRIYIEVQYVGEEGQCRDENGDGIICAEFDLDPKWKDSIPDLAKCLAKGYAITTYTKQGNV